MKPRVWLPITQRFHRPRNHSVLLDAAVWTPVLIALVCSLVSGDPQWFQRSGSWAVAVAVYGEKKGWLPLSKALRAEVIGTLIWGWGDLIGTWV